MLENVKRVETQIPKNNFIMMIFGPPGHGKSFLAASLRGALVVDYDHGLIAVPDCAVLDPDKHESEQASSFALFELAMTELAQAEKPPYHTVVVDTFGKLDEAAEKSICDENGEKDINAGKLGYGKGLARKAERHLLWLNKLKTKGISVVLLCHEKPVRTKTKDGLEQVEIQPDLSERLFSAIGAEMDHIVRIVAERKVGADGKTVTIERTLRGEPSMTQFRKSRGDVFCENIKATWPAIGAAFKTARDRIAAEKADTKTAAPKAAAVKEGAK